MSDISDSILDQIVPPNPFDRPDSSNSPDRLTANLLAAPKPGYDFSLGGDLPITNLPKVSTKWTTTPPGGLSQPFIGNNGNDVTGDYIPGGKFSNEPAGSDASIDPQYAADAARRAGNIGLAKQYEEIANPGSAAKEAADSAAWSKIFTEIPASDILRGQRNVTNMVSQALDAKTRLAAGVEQNANNIYAQGRQFQDWQDQSPLRDELLRGSLDADAATSAAHGAAARYQQAQNIATANDTAAFYNQLSRVQSPIGSPEHANEVMGIVQQHPYAVATKGVQDSLTLHANAHDLASRVLQPSPGLYNTPQQLQAENPGATYRQDVKSKQYYVVQGGKSETETKPSANAMRDLAQLNASRAKEMANLESARDDNARVIFQKKVNAINAQIGAWHDTYKPKSANSFKDQAALDWANANKNDPRSAKILALHGQ